MKTIEDVFASYKHSLKNVYGVNEVEALTLMVINEITGLSRAKIKAFTDELLTSSHNEKLTNILTRLQNGEPVQYILGHTEFYGLPFKVNPAVLIPRPETEELVEWILNTINGMNRPVRILDIGTGSGCIAISLKKNLEIAQVSAVDISSKALNVAKENADMNHVDVNFSQLDILDQHNSQHLTGHYSLIVSNPPYVTQHDKTLMHKNVTDFEPHTALFVPEDDPLIFYNAIADLAIKRLIPGGLLFFEINENLGQETVELLLAKQFKNIELRKDMSGKDRMIKTNI